ncbi:uncharacterized protein LOC104426439 [Eucalyptus grandis]|uniref:uncharacterized protein LOC104426439 n=1 Tax=Eucalyptus grandis TaxID=71139 RepID=UPI00192EC893|nr:uncharacterized protein LOC104426439 [Eucalyptus grandis]
MSKNMRETQERRFVELNQGAKDSQGRLTAASELPIAANRRHFSQNAAKTEHHELIRSVEAGVVVFAISGISLFARFLLGGECGRKQAANKPEVLGGPHRERNGCSFHHPFIFFSCSHDQSFEDLLWRPPPSAVSHFPQSQPSLQKSPLSECPSRQALLRVEVPKVEPKFQAPFLGFTRTAEIWNSRACMIGLIGTFIVELIINKGILQVIGVEVGKGLDLPL